jgi:glycosyltransferase involved in cell wall biosynthesis
MRRAGARVTLVAPLAWNEGGHRVELEVGDDDFVRPARTVGRHPYLFLYDPRPLWRAVRSGSFDVVDIHEEPASLAAAEVLTMLWLARSRAAVCLYCAQNLPKRYPVPFRWFERVALRRAVAVHTCNEAAGRILRSKGFTGMLCNLGLGVDVERFGRADPPGGDADHAALRVGYVGRLEPHKGVDVLVEAIARVPGAVLEIVGGGPERDRLDRLIHRLALGERARIAGFTTPAELPAVYRRFDVVVVPSLETPGWVEQFGRVAVEAMASGVPVVASSSGSLPEVVGEAGVLVPPGDPEALAAALAHLAADPERRAELARRGRARAQRWSWDAIASRQLDLYRSMCERTSAGAPRGAP